MNQKGFVNIIVIGIVLAVILGVAGYFVLNNKIDDKKELKDKIAIECSKGGKVITQTCAKLLEECRIKYPGEPQCPVGVNNISTATPPPDNDNVSQNPSATQPPVPSPSSLPTTCTNQQDGMPVITSLSSYAGSVGAKLEIRGCNFSGFEGDKNTWIENSKGVKGLLHGEAGSTSKLLKVTLKSPLCQKDTSYSGLPCDAFLTLTPGIYKIYAMPWGKKSNEAAFMIE